jgi:hypothetical protein
MNRRILRCAGLVAGLVAIPCAVVVTAASPAAAFSQYCGEGQIGIYHGGYPPGTEDTGHPEWGSAYESWGGKGAIDAAKAAALAIDRASAFVEWGKKLHEALIEDELTATQELAYSVASLVLKIGGVAAEASVQQAEQAANEMDACAAVFNGDLVDVLYVARLEEELGQLDPANGPVKVPSNVFLLPDDGSPEWTSDTTKYADRNNHGDLTIPYVDGAIDNEYVGAAVIVRNLIAHMEAHGMNTGGGTVWVPGVGLVHQDGAKDLWWDGMRLLEDGRVRLAYAKFAEAYRTAVTTHTTS